MSLGTSLAKSLPDESIPLRRIGRYACYALTVAALGFLGADIVFFVLDLFTGLIESGLGRLYAGLWLDLLDFVQEVVEVFSVLVGLGVFLSQFERGDL
ncbi:hypothetical protein ACH9L7_17490 (plasmid) [Haloferax sp. S1W]|uniref:hypothetical protein n=1 Tax=Haloferax sp. S1W TaxID=3377110 RepID=UPI0037C86780